MKKLTYLFLNIFFIIFSGQANSSPPTQAQSPLTTLMPAAVYMVDLPIEYAYGELGDYSARRLKVVAELATMQFQECGKDKENRLSFDYYRPTPTQAFVHNQVLSEQHFSGYAMTIYVSFDATNKTCTDFVDSLHTSYGKNMRLEQGYSPIDYAAERRIQEEKNACLSAKNECMRDVESYHCKYRVRAENLVRNKKGELKAAILERTTSGLFKVCFFDKAGQKGSVIPLYVESIELVQEAIEAANNQ